MANAPMGDHDLIHILLNGLPSEFDVVVIVIQLLDPLPSLNAVIAILFDFKCRIRHTQAATSSTIVLLSVTL